MPHLNIEAKYQALLSISGNGNTPQSVLDARVGAGVHRSTVYRWLDKLESTGSLARTPGSGRRPALSIDDEVEIHLLATDNPFMLPSEIKTHLGKLIGYWTKY